MFTISDIISDIDHNCVVNNMQEDRFSYRVVFYINENGKGTKHYMDTVYSGLRESLESIIRNYLSMTNNIVIAQTTALKDGKCVCLQSKAYPFSLDEYFRQIGGGGRGNQNKSTIRGRLYCCRGCY